MPKKPVEETEAVEPEPETGDVKISKATPAKIGAYPTQPGVPPPENAQTVWTAQAQAGRVYDALAARIKARQDFPKPERSLLTVGDIDWPTTCSQFAVSARRVYNGTPGAEQAGPVVPHFGVQLRTLELGISYTFCWPQKTPVLSAAEETASALEVLRRADILIEEAEKAYYGGELVDDCNQSMLGQFTFITPESFVSGVTLLLAVQVS